MGGAGKTLPDGRSQPIGPSQPVALASQTILFSGSNPLREYPETALCDRVGGGSLRGDREADSSAHS
jgi:hypothetical protein